MRALVLALLLASPAPAQEFFTLKGHGGPIMGIAVAPSGQIATASFDNAVGLWDGAAPRWLDGHAAAVNAVAFLPDGGLVSAGDDFTLRRWPGGAVLGEHQGKVMALAVAPDGDTVASASWDGTIGLWPLDGTPGTLLKGHDQGVNALAFDGARLFSASVDGTVRLWDTASATELRQIVRHGFGINELVLSPQGWLAYGAVDGVTRIVDPETGTEIADFTLDRRPILALALSPDGTRLAVGDGEGYIMLIDTERWEIAADFRATLRGPVWALAFSADGRNIHAGGLDEALYSWPVTALNGDRMAGEEPSFLQDPDSMDNGERQFARKCSICHSVTPGSQRRAGPSLHGLFGRRAGTVPDYRYSEILDGSQIVWDDTTIDALFDLGPDHYIPGTKMPMQRITDKDDRADLIAWLRHATAGGTE
ncbi:MAG: c-type cytochrome [Pseudooceanicola sp.]|nr:c-type cytochrome [Pseudooceanicola sp.]